MPAEQPGRGAGRTWPQVALSLSTRPALILSASRRFFFSDGFFFFFSSASLGLSPDETQCVPRERRPPGTGRAGFRRPISRPPSLIAGESDAHLQSGLFPSFLVTVFLKGTPRRIAPWPRLLQTFAVT